MSIAGSAGAFSPKNIRLPCHDDGHHTRIAFDASVDAVALQIKVVDETLCGVDDGTAMR